ncbi:MULTISPECIES: DUF6122 family protein [Algibacter]|uniref:DUF6122 family protein n=1 Tax=Algibacter TaxID=261827 RepID=UPI00131D860C|nr:MULTISPECIES: DUF6122 family protein [Algibacter]MDO7138382.1 DUF6122 family protein [Algibacter lectus]
MLQSIAHYGCHFLLPLAVALIWFKPNWKVAYLIMIAGMLIDLDHLLADPIFDSNRCSVNFHPLHTYYALVIYIALLFFKKTRLIGLGLVIHILADTVDCSFM